MAVRSTRSKRQETTSEPPEPSKHGALVPDAEPPHVLILPQNAASGSRVITIESTGSNGSTVSQRYFVDPEQGFYEFTSVARSARDCRSWLLSPDIATEGDTDGHVISSSDLLVATPLHPIFVLLRIPGVLGAQDATRKEFDVLENRMWTLRNNAPQLAGVLDDSGQSGHLREMLEKAIQSVCCMENINGEDVGYSFDQGRLAAMILQRAQKAAKHGLSPSLEERFVTQPLQLPEMSIRREDSGVSIAGHLDEGAKDDGEERSADNGADATVKDLLRLRVAYNFMVARYVPCEGRASIHRILQQQSPGFPNFAPLDHHLELIAKAKAEVQALRSISDNISRKRAADDEGALEKLDAKKRKKDEEEQRKKQMSQGVKKLLKADTSGMKKLSSFFQKK